MRIGWTKPGFRRALVLAVVWLLALRAQADVYVGAWTPVYHGVDYMVGFAGVGSPCVEKVHALRIHRYAEGVRFYSTPRCPGWAPNKAETRRQTTREFVASTGVQAAVNGDFYDLAKAVTNLQGLAISEGQILSPPAGTDSLLITRDNRARVEVTTAATDLHGVWTAVSGHGRMLVDGVVQETWPERHPRTAVGVSRDGRYIYLITLDGRQPGVSAGATTGELGAWMLRLGAWQAINLDGGGSTTMALADGRGGAVILNVPVGDSKTPNTERRNGNHLGVFALPLSAFCLPDVPKVEGGPTMDRAPKLHVESRTTEPLLVADQPHEDFCLGYCSVLREGARWRMWYEAYDHTYRTDADGYLCYAESQDGLHWKKPALDLVKVGEGRANNVLISGRATGGIHGHTVFLDPTAPPAERYKIVFTRFVEGKWQVFGGTSADGFFWHLGDRPILAANSDTQSVCFRDDDLYRLYVRMWTEEPFGGKRMVGYTDSPTFGGFRMPTPILRPDDRDPADLHFYNSAATMLRHGLYLMFPSAFSTAEDVVRVHVAWSADGVRFHRLGRKPLLDLGAGFDSKGLYVGPGGVPSEKPGTWWFYYVGTGVGHDQNLPDRAHRAGGIGRFLLSVK